LFGFEDRFRPKIYEGNGRLAARLWVQFFLLFTRDRQQISDGQPLDDAAEEVLLSVKG
jgi:hypothetical protein